MGFHEQAGDADSHCRTRQHRHELALPTGNRTLPARQLDGMGGVKHHRATRLAQDRQRTHVRHQIVVTEGRPALADHQRISPAVGLVRLVNDMLHVTRGQKLPFLDVDRLAASSHSVDEIGLPTKKSRRLQNIDHRSNRSDIGFIMHVGQHRHADLATHFVKDFQPRITPRPARRFAGAAIGLVVRGLENVGKFQPGADFLHLPGHFQTQFERFGGTRPGDQKQRLMRPDFKTAEFHFLPRQSIAARRKAVNKGCPCRGVEVNSG